jgi:hypothetical protein
MGVSILVCVCALRFVLMNGGSGTRICRHEGKLANDCYGHELPLFEVCVDLR